MNSTLRRALEITMILFLGVAGLVSCGGGVGSSGNNNQGVVFTLLGFYSGAALGCSELPEDVSGITAISVPVSSSSSDGLAFPGEVVAAVGLQNNLDSQALSVDRLNLEYFIPGSSVQPPSTIQPLPLMLGPSVLAGDTSTGNDSNSSLPNSAFLGIGSCAIAEFRLIPAQIRSWISLNRNSLPEAPFDLFVTVTAEGESTSGQRYTTNDETIVVDITPDVSIAYAGGNATNVV